MKSIRNLAFMSLVGLVGLWGCNSKQYATSTAQEYDDLYGNSADGEVFAGNRTNYTDEDRDSRNSNPDYRTGKVTPSQQGQADYYDESYLSTRGIGRNYSPNGGYNSGFADGYSTASNWNWGWSNPWRSNYFGNSWNTMGGMNLMLGGLNSPWCMNGRNNFGSPFGYGSMYSPFDNFGSMYAYDPFGFNNFGFGNSFGFGSGFGYGNRFNNTTNIFYSNPVYTSNNGVGAIDNTARRTQDYNRMNRSGSTRNDNFNNSPSYSGRRSGSADTGPSGSSSTYSNGSVTNGGRSRGNNSNTYYGSESGSNSRGYSSNGSSSTTTDNNSNYSGRSRGNSSSTYYGSSNSGSGNSNSSGYSSGRSSSSSSDFGSSSGGGGRSSGGGSSSGGSSGGSSSGGGGGGRSGGPR